MAYWLMKSEPDVFSFEMLQARTSEPWDGVRNYQARNYLRDQKPGDLVLFYHSSCAQPGIVGIARVIAEARPDPSSWDPDSDYYDPRSSPDAPRWFMTEIAAVRPLKRLLTLDRLRALPELCDLPLVKKGTRLSVMPVADHEYCAILALENAHEH